MGGKEWLKTTNGACCAVMIPERGLGVAVPARDSLPVTFAPSNLHRGMTGIRRLNRHVGVGRQQQEAEEARKEGSQAARKRRQKLERAKAAAVETTASAGRR